MTPRDAPAAMSTVDVTGRQHRHRLPVTLQSSTDDGCETVQNLGGPMTPDVAGWLALLRVHQGGVTKLDGHCLNHGRPVANYVAGALDELIRNELLSLGRSTPSGQQQVCVTHAQQIRYATLNANRTGEVHRGGR